MPTVDNILSWQGHIFLSPPHPPHFVSEGGGPGAPLLLSQVAQTLADLELGSHGRPLHDPRQLLALAVHGAHLAAQRGEDLLNAVRVLAGRHLAVAAAMFRCPRRALVASDASQVDEVALVGRQCYGQALVAAREPQVCDELLCAGPAVRIRDGEDQEESIGPRNWIMSQFSRGGLKRK